MAKRASFWVLLVWGVGIGAALLGLGYITGAVSVEEWGRPPYALHRVWDWVIEFLE